MNESSIGEIMKENENENDEETPYQYQKCESENNRPIISSG
jgi:hypothetical protein